MNKPNTVDPAAAAKAAAAKAAAAAAAARIAATIAAAKKTASVDVPPIRAALVAPAPPPRPAPNTAPGTAKIGETYQQDGDFIRDIEINDLRNRYTLTKGSVQKKIKDDTGADVTTRGEYYPDKSLATAASPPLYLRVTSTSEEGLESAIKAIQTLMEQDLPNLVDERRFRRNREPEQVERDEYGRRKWPEEKIPVDLEPINGFNLRAQVVGRGGDNVKYIQSDTGCKVQIKGRGSGFIEANGAGESDEPMYLHIAGPKPEGVAKAKGLCEELLERVKSDYQQFKERPPQERFGNDGYANGRSGSGYGDRPPRERNHSYGHGGNNYGGNNYGANYAGGTYGGNNYGGSHGNHGGNHGGTYANNQMGYDSSSTAQPQAATATTASYASYADYYAQGGTDVYAMYGGYENYRSMCEAWWRQNPQGATAAGVGGAAPPAAEVPSSSGSAAPPGGYHAVPPPPGM